MNYWGLCQGKVQKLTMLLCLGHPVQNNIVAGSLLLTAETAPSPVLEGVATGIMACALGRPCDLNSGPVCVIDDSGLPRTFENRCMADLAYCRYGTCKY